MNGRGPATAGRDSAIGAYRTEVHPYRTQYITYHEKTLRLQIAITAVCSLEIYQIAINASVKDRKLKTIFKKLGQNPIVLIIFECFYENQIIPNIKQKWHSKELSKLTHRNAKVVLYVSGSLTLS